MNKKKCRPLIDAANQLPQQFYETIWFNPLDIKDFQEKKINQLPAPKVTKYKVNHYRRLKRLVKRTEAAAKRKGLTNLELRIAIVQSAAKYIGQVTKAGQQAVLERHGHSKPFFVNTIV